MSQGEDVLFLGKSVHSHDLPAQESVFGPDLTFLNMHAYL